MSYETLITFLIATAVVVVIPGPNIILITTDSIRHGFKNSLATVMGVSAGMVPLYALSLAGISTLLISFSWLFEAVRFVGAAYLVFLGICQLRDSVRHSHTEQAVVSRGNRFFTRGFLISVTNPKGLFFAGAFFPQFLDAGQPMMPQILILCIGSLVVASTIGALYALFAKTAASCFASEKFHKTILKVSGFTLIMFGTSLLFTDKNEFI